MSIRVPSEATLSPRNDYEANLRATLSTSYPNHEMHHQDQHSPTPPSKSPFNSHNVGGYSEYIHDNGDVVERIVTRSPSTVVYETASPSRTIVTRTVVSSPTSVVTRTVSSPSTTTRVVSSPSSTTTTRVIRTTVSSPSTVQADENDGITVPPRSPIHHLHNLSPNQSRQEVPRSPVFRDISLELQKEDFEREFARTVRSTTTTTSSPSNNRTVVTTTSSPSNRTIVTRTISPSKKETVITTTTTSSPVSSPVRRVVTYSPSRETVERIETTYVSSPASYNPSRGSPLKTATPKLSAQN
jgi:hypothetical protein